MNRRWLDPDGFRIAHAASEAFRAFQKRGPSLRRAALLCDLGDALTLTRPRGWAERSRRTYEAALRRLGDSGTRQAVPTGSDVAQRAHAALREARRPYRRFAFVLARVTTLAVVGLIELALLASVVSPAARAWLFPPDLAAMASWTASSAHLGAESSGRSAGSERPYFFHTDGQDRPWIRITLPRKAKIRKIVIDNRSDCCGERALPLNVEVPDGNDWRLICQRRSPFSSWTCHPPPTTTSVIRIEIPTSSMLHLKRESIYE